MTPNFVIITPAYNEAGYIGRTIESVLAQSVLPLRWVIVDDDSIDATPQIVSKYARQYDWIRLVRRVKDTQQSYYSSNVYAIFEGIKNLGEIQYDYLAIVDADIALPRDYYSRIFERFEQDEKLGIASGIYMDRIGENQFRKVLSDRRSTPKAMMVFRRACFEKIGGFIPMKYGGEDTVACFAARMHGWKTWSFPDLVAIHNKPIGTGHSKGICTIRFRNGIADYYLGSPAFFMFSKCVRRFFKEKPFFCSGLMRFLGYFYASIWMREKRQIEDELVCYIRKELNSRLFSINRIPQSFRATAIKL